MHPRRIAARALASTLLLVGLVDAAATGQSQPPIRVIFDNHMDPLPPIDLEARHEVYLDHISWVTWALDQVEPLGVQVSFLSCGEFMEFVSEEGALGPGAALLRRLYGMGRQIGSHSHQEYQRGAHDWPDVPVPDLNWSRRSWSDNIRLVNDGILTALGPDLPEPLANINCVKGAHLPKTEAEYHELMSEFDLGIRQAGPEEDYYAYFNHHIWHPFRPSAANYLAEDLTAPFVAVPAGPVIGQAAVHHGIFQDMTAPNVKRMFLQAYLNWRFCDRQARPEKIWTFGWASHGHDFAPGSESRAALVEVTSWLQADFMNSFEPTGSKVATWSTYRETAAAYRDWEAAHPGSSSFSFDGGRVRWSEYPWLRAVAEELEQAHYVDRLSLPGDVQGHLLERDDSGMAVLWDATDSAVIDLSAWLQAPVRIVDLESGLLVGSDPAAVPVSTSPVIATEYAPHVTLEGVPRIGETITLRVYGRPGEIALLFVSGGGLVADSPHHGRLLLDPSRGFLRLAAGVIPPPLGFFPVAIPLPDDGNLVGLEVHFQGIVTRFEGAGWLFTVDDVVVTIEG
ncbi:MAG: hypothetical protein AB1486_17500 [Planctomycetota bacterium]